MSFNRSPRTLDALLSGPDHPLTLPEAALIVARHDDPDLDVQGYLGRLDRDARRLSARVPGDAARPHLIAMLNRFMFEELGYTGAVDDYYDPRNSLLNQVMDRRVGIPISLSIIYMGIGRALGLPLAGVAFPGHFLVRCPVHDGLVVLDPFHRGITLSDGALRQHLARQGIPGFGAGTSLAPYLQPADSRTVVARMLRNLKKIYLDQGALPKALEMMNLTLAVLPTAMQELRERGLLQHRMACYPSALRDLQHFARWSPDAAGDEEVQRTLADLLRRGSLLH